MFQPKDLLNVCVIFVCSDSRMFPKLKVMCMPWYCECKHFNPERFCETVKKLAGEQVLGSDNVVDRLTKDAIDSIDK